MLFLRQLRLICKNAILLVLKFSNKLERALKILKHYWGYTSFRPMQEMVLRSVLMAKDVFAMMPTGGGKSLCYQVPALVMDGTALIISPLISLIEDQCAALQKRNVPAVYVHSGMNQGAILDAYEQVAQGQIKLLYLSPERLQTPLFQEFALSFPINLVAVDEAHCISQWGHDFRPAYRKIAEVRALFPEVPILALTATATEEVKTDIVQQLQLRHPALFEQSVSRANLSYHLKYAEVKYAALLDAFKKVQGTSIVYCRTRKRVEDAAEMLRQSLSNPVFFYHAGLNKKERHQVQENWMGTKDGIISATTAFGMGIDKPDVRLVAHLDVPESIEQYYQEVGRAGRDGLPSYGLLLFNNKDLSQLAQSSEKRFPELGFIKEVYAALAAYLQLGLNEGEGQIYAFDFYEMLQRFPLPPLQTHSALKILEREGFLEWNENANTQYTIRLTTNRATLAYLEKNSPTLYELVEMLLRTYGSIYNFETAVDFFGLAKKLGLDKAAFEERLFQLQDLGVLVYRPAIVGSHILWLHPRCEPHLLPFDTELLRNLKEAYEKKVSSMMAFVKDQQTCRNILLAQYFNQQAEQACGHCDNCQRAKTESRTHLKDVREALLAQLSQAGKPCAITDLLAHFPETKEQHVLQAIRNLIDEGAVIYEDGNISL